MNTPLNSIPSRGAVLTASGSPRMGRLVRRSFTAMTPVERTRVLAMYGVIAGLHLAGFFILFVFVVPSHYKGLGIGVAVLAYTLGLRHAFDADHISAIDNTTRKVMGERQGTGKPRPLGYGFFFSLGPLHGRGRDRGRDRHGREDRVLRGVEQQLGAGAVRRAVRDGRLGVASCS